MVKPLLTRAWRSIGRSLDWWLGAMTADGPARAATLPRWVFIAVYLIVHATLIFVLAPLPFLIGNSDPIGDWVQMVWQDQGYFWVGGGTMLACCALQIVLLWPVRRPVLTPSGWPLRLSAALAALLGSLLAVGLFAAVADIPWLLDRTLLSPEVVNRLSARQAHPSGGWRTQGESPVIHSLWLTGLMLGISWLILTPIFLAFLRRNRPETGLARLAARLFTGTVVEAVAIIPLDVMVRRKSDCYCEHGTFWALVACIGVGTVVAGPAAWLPILARRRKRWWRRCQACGYDMRGLPKADRCPECGTGWRAAKTPKAT